MPRGDSQYNGTSKELGARSYIKRLRVNNPCISASSIARRVGVSRERVRQILTDEGLSTRRYIQKYVCAGCGKITNNTRFCSRKCRHEYYNPQVECYQCHKLFRRKASQLYSPRQLHKYYFCSKHCQGVWLSKEYGWGRSKSSNT